jgi:hypothetical protein
VRLDRVSRYRLTAASLQRALAAGFDQAQVAAFLTRQGGSALPIEVQGRLEDWVRQYRRVTLRHAVVLEPDDPAGLPELRRDIEGRSLRVTDLDGRTLLVEAAPSAIDALRAHLAGSRYAPRWGDAPVQTGPSRPAAPRPARATDRRDPDPD